MGSPALDAHDVGTLDTGTPCLPLAGTQWTARGEKEGWSSVALSADGNALLAAGAHLRTSTDAGSTWAVRANAPFARQEWRSVASSADGTRLIAAAPCGNARRLEGCGYLYTSADGGATWMRRGPGPLDWRAVASSADGMKLAAVIGSPHGDSRGRIYLSSDAGQTWRARGPSRSFAAIALSADGNTLVAAAGYPGGYLHRSTNAGRTWRPTGPWLPWATVAMSADGTKLAAGAHSDFLYTSVDGGRHWRRRASEENWVSMATSADGTFLIAAAAGSRAFGNAGRLCTSRDSGATWVDHSFDPTRTQEWSSVAASADGTRVVATEFNGRVYVSSGPATRGTTTLNSPGPTTCDEPAPLPPPFQAPPTEQEPGQRCPKSMLYAIGKQLDIRPLRVQWPWVRGSACAPDPEHRERTIVVAAYECDASTPCLGTTGRVVALLEHAPLRVVASHQDTIDGYSSETGGFRIVPMAYHLAEDVTAFAIDDRREIPPRLIRHPIIEAWGSTDRTLYALDSDRLKPVVAVMPMYHWRLLPGPEDRVESRAIERVDFRLVVRDTATVGYHDLLVMGSCTRDDGQPCARNPFRFRLRYDGNQYRREEMVEEFLRWMGR